AGLFGCYGTPIGTYKGVCGTHARGLGFRETVRIGCAAGNACVALGRHTLRQLRLPSFPRRRESFLLPDNFLRNKRLQNPAKIPACAGMTE
ncbi:hypothetical protein, partial [Neisseria bacilliformis]|uniref:hypothetical protein n=1 Tax=Neisseria bacilliformis TaxID=267212 RepID=UPI0028EA81A9